MYYIEENGKRWTIGDHFTDKITGESYTIEDMNNNGTIMGINDAGWVFWTNIHDDRIVWEEARK